MRFPLELDSSIRGRVADMERAMAAEAHFSAISLALTIPDACGKRLYPKEKSGERYVRWFDRYVAKYEYLELDKESCGRGAESQESQATYFTGADCYQLRCAFLHEASNAPRLRTGKPYFKTIQFRLFDRPGGNHLGSSISCMANEREHAAFETITKGETTHRLDLDVVKFVGAIASGVDRFLKEHPDMNDDADLREDLFYHPILDFRIRD